MSKASLRAAHTDVEGFIRFLATRVIEDRCQQSAASLTWVTLFALVPLLTVFYTILSLVPSFQALGGRIEELVFQHFVPSTGSEIRFYLGNFTAQARSLSVAGTAILFVSAWLMLLNIEETFNRIWRVRQARHGMARFASYWAILSLGPLLAGAGLLTSTYLFSLQALDALPESLRLRSTLLGLLPELFTFTTFTLIYAAVPNCRVRLRHAALGGLLSTVIFDVGKAVFGWAVAQGNYGLVYGTFAALPLFLLWLYLSWLLLLAGAEFVYALENYRSHREVQLPDVLATLAVLERLHREHVGGGVLHDADMLAPGAMLGHFTLHPESWERIRQRLLDARLLRSTLSGEYVLGTDADSVSLWTLYRLFGAPGRNTGPTVGHDLPAWFRDAEARIARGEQQLGEAMAPSLLQIFEYKGNTNASDAN